MPAYSPIRAIAPGSHIGFIICMDCGTALVFDPTDKLDVMELHNEWHDRVVEVEQHAEDSRQHVRDTEDY